MAEWLDAVIDGANSTIIRKSAMKQRWYLVSCVASCRNAGPFRVWTSEGETFICSVCDRVMRQRQDSE